MMGDELTPELERLAAFVDQQPPEARQAFQLAWSWRCNRGGPGRIPVEGRSDELLA